ncbi:MAG: hypothetical protein K6A90_08450 [Lachnospiraceae bacterium]|nr:hypothetical protein [Lachnospiraceae bacterium]
MEQYEMIKKEELDKISKEELLDRYNDVVETTWLYLEKIRELTGDNEQLMYDYDKVSEQLYSYE